MKKVEIPSVEVMDSWFGWGAQPSWVVPEPTVAPAPPPPPPVPPDPEPEPGGGGSGRGRPTSDWLLVVLLTACGWTVVMAIVMALCVVYRDDPEVVETMVVCWPFLVMFSVAALLAALGCAMTYGRRI